MSPKKLDNVLCDACFILLVNCWNSKIFLLELLHTHLGFIFPKVFTCLLFIISHYPVSYNLGENIPPGYYSLSIYTSVWLAELSLIVALVLSPCNIGIITMLIRPCLGIITIMEQYPLFPELTPHYSLFSQGKTPGVITDTKARSN